MTGVLLVGYFRRDRQPTRNRLALRRQLKPRALLGTPLDESTPDNSTLTHRNRLPHEVFDEVFQFVLRIVVDKKLLAAKIVGVDSTTLEAHLCDSGGMRRNWLNGVGKVTKRYLIAVAAHNLGRILRKLFEIGKPRALQGEGGLAAFVSLVMIVLASLDTRRSSRAASHRRPGLRVLVQRPANAEVRRSSSSIRPK